jgi:hypothetical protein
LQGALADEILSGIRTVCSFGMQGGPSLASVVFDPLNGFAEPSKSKYDQSTKEVVALGVRIGYLDGISMSVLLGGVYGQTPPWDVCS